MATGIENADLSKNEARTVMCSASFKGEMTQEHFYILLKYLDDMKLRGWVFETHSRRNGRNNMLKIDYVLVNYEDRKP